MFRYVIIPLVAIVALIALWLYLGPGQEVSLEYDGVRYSEDLRNVVLWGVAAVATIIALWSLVVWLWQLPGRIKSGLGLRRRDQALHAMEDALIAGAEGRPLEARKSAERARKLIESPTLGALVSAQAAEAAGDRRAAVAHYTAMLDDPRTEATAQRGLAQHYVATGDYASAIEHAHLAYSQNPNAGWAFDTLFRAQVAAHQWNDALRTLDLGEERRHIDLETATRRRVVLETALADRLEEAGRAEEARELAVAAATRDPEFAPAVALATRLLTRVGEDRRARKLIEAGWARRPHPALGFAYRDVIEGQKGGLTGRFSRKSIEDLVRINPGHRESVLLEVEQAIASDNFVEAWGKLSPLLSEADPSSRLCLLAARCEAGLGNDADARQWMERAATAPTEGDWSDLDPMGDAFVYGDRDWQRLVGAYGDDAKLIHPRLDANAPTRLAVNMPVAKPAPIPATGSAAADAPVVPAADTAPRLAPEELPPAPIPAAPAPATSGQAESASDIARRLDSLLDSDPPKS